MIEDWVDWPGRPPLPLSFILAHYLDRGDASPMLGAGYTEIVAAVSGTAAWGTANRAFYLPVYVTAPTPIVQMTWRNGAALNGAVDVGIYSRNFVRLASSGAITQAGVSVGQATALTLTLFPELYYLAISSSSTTGTFWRWTYGATLGPLLAQSVGIRIEEAAHPLPAIATPVKPVSDFVPMLAATGRSLL